MTTWDYRVTKRWVGPELDDYQFAIREVYYDDAHNVILWSVDPVAAVGESRDGVEDALRRMLGAALYKGVLNLDMVVKRLADEDSGRKRTSDVCMIPACGCSDAPHA